MFSDFLNLFIFDSKNNLGAVVKALQTKGLFQSLAEPNLIAENGKEASFLAGGEYPYPVVQGQSGGQTVTIQFKEFGVRLHFTPTIVGSDLVKLKVAPEVSSLDFANAVTISGLPRAGHHRRAARETEVELQDGQTFAIAGLMNNTVTSQLQKIPGIGDIPILGFLFKSKAAQKNQTELVVMITPTILRRGSTGVSPKLPRPDGAVHAAGQEDAAVAGAVESGCSPPGVAQPAARALPSAQPPHRRHSPLAAGAAADPLKRRAAAPVPRCDRLPRTHVAGSDRATPAKPHEDRAGRASWRASRTKPRASSRRKQAEEDKKKAAAGSRGSQAEQAAKDRRKPAKAAREQAKLQAELDRRAAEAAKSQAESGQETGRDRQEEGRPGRRSAGAARRRRARPTSSRWRRSTRRASRLRRSRRSRSRHTAVRPERTKDERPDRPPRQGEEP